jgi:hypothetical protein
VDGETHGDECGQERDGKHGQSAEGDVEDTADAELGTHGKRESNLSLAFPSGYSRMLKASEASDAETEAFAHGFACSARVQACG